MREFLERRGGEEGGRYEERVCELRMALKRGGAGAGDDCRREQDRGRA